MTTDILTQTGGTTLVRMQSSDTNTGWNTAIIPNDDLHTLAQGFIEEGGTVERTEEDGWVHFIATADTMPTVKWSVYLGN